MKTTGAKTIPLIRRLAFLILTCLPSIGARAQQADNHRPAFLNRTNMLLIAADAGAKFSDWRYTMRNMEHNGHEYNPVLRPFVTRGRAVSTIWPVASLLGETLLSYELHRHRHPKLSRVVLLIGIGSNAVGAAHRSR